MMNHTMTSKIVKKILFYSLVILICAIIISPFIILVSYSLKSNAEIFSFRPTLIPMKTTLASYKNVLLSYKIGGTGFITWTLNTLIVCLPATAISILFASLAGYSLSRFNFRGKRVFWSVILVIQTLPVIIVLISFYILLGKLRMLDRLESLFLSYIMFFIPVSTWLLQGFFRTISREIEEAARIDGCSYFGVFWRIVFPLAIPGICAVGLFCFVIGWGDYLFASVIIRSARNWTLPLGLMSFQGERQILWGEIMAGSVMITIPIVILFLYLQRYLIKGLMAGSIKG